MADNVDLMVVGTNDGLTADELTKRLVAEFNQPEDAVSYTHLTLPTKA